MAPLLLLRRGLTVLGLAVALLTAVAVTPSSAVGTWTQVGNPMAGATTADSQGLSVSLSGDGSRIAVGAPSATVSTRTYVGVVRVYDDIGGTWTQVGNTIDGLGPGQDWFGWNVSLSRDGTRVAVVARTRAASGTESGSVRVFELVDGIWTQVGQEIAGSRSYSYVASVALTADGSRLIMGEYGTGIYAGRARIFEDVDGTWTQVGVDIDGVATGYTTGDFLGTSVDITADGTRIVIGAPSSPSAVAGTGKAMIFEDVAGTWTQVGADVTGDAPGDNAGYSVSIADDGARIVMGAPFANGKIGWARAYELQSGAWVQLGSTIDGLAVDDWAGVVVAIASDGLRIAVDSHKTAGTNGIVRVYDFMGSDWSQSGGDIVGVAGTDPCRSMSISGLGYRVACGAPRGSSSKGDATVYQQDPTPIDVTFDANGGTGAPAAMTGGARELLALPTTVPTRDGYAFVGWSDGTTTHAAGESIRMPVSGSVTLVAQWTEAPTPPTTAPSDGGSGSGSESGSGDAVVPAFTG